MADYSQHKLTITLNFDAMNIPKCVNMEDVAEILTCDQWNDGRYPFYSEMLHVGLRHMLEHAVREATFKSMEREFRGQTVKTTISETSLPYLKTEEAMQGVHLCIMDSIKSAEIGPPVYVEEVN